MAQIRSKPFGVTKEGANVTEYILSNPGGMSVSVLDYGCVIKNIIVPAKNGPVDVVLGHDTMADYETTSPRPAAPAAVLLWGAMLTVSKTPSLRWAARPTSWKKLRRASPARLFFPEDL